MLSFLLRFATVCLTLGMVSLLFVPPAGADSEASSLAWNTPEFRSYGPQSALFSAPRLSDQGAFAEPDVKRRLRRVLKKEITREVALLAREIISLHHAEPYGTEISFDSGGVEYVARIERHFHPPGGEARPWGYHPGVSVLVEREE